MSKKIFTILHSKICLSKPVHVNYLPGESHEIANLMSMKKKKGIENKSPAAVVIWA